MGQSTNFSLLKIVTYLIIIILRKICHLTKMAQLDLPDAVFNWLVDYFRGHEHCTQYNGVTSAMLPILASIVQGSAVGPASYVVNAADLTVLSSINQLVKIADDTYLVIPASSVEMRAAKLYHVEQWAAVNNLRLNCDKCTEIIFVDPRQRRSVEPPPLLTGIKRVTMMKMLGVTVTNTLSVAEHVQAIIRACAPSIHALRVLRCMA